MSYSQNDEEEFIVKFFSEQQKLTPCRLLDIGAYDGIQLSNTRKLLEIGWSGVLVEPAPHNVTKLIQNCRSISDRVVIIQAAVAATGRLDNLYLDDTPGREWSTTINDALALEIGSVMSPNPVKLIVPVLAPYNLATFGPFDFINIDAEWEDFEILKMMRFEPSSNLLDQCRLICIEPNGIPQRADMIKVLNEIGFEVAHETRENIIAKRKS